VFPKISTTAKNHLKIRLTYAYKSYSFGGTTSPDTLTIGYTKGCDGNFVPLWKKGGANLATAGSIQTSYTPVAADWRTISLDVDSLLQYPEVALGFENKSGFGNRLFIDNIKIDTTDNCPLAPTIAVNNDTICVGSTLILSVDSVAGATYQWTGPNNFSSGNRVATRVTALSSTGTYSASVTLNGCTSPATSQAITVVAAPTIPGISQTGNDLTGPANMSNYIWIVGTDTLPENTRTLTAPVSGSYVLVVYNAAGCFRRSNPRNVVVTSNAALLFKSGLLLFPNPTTDKVQVVSKGKEISFEELYNSVGKRLFVPVTKKSEGNLEFDLHQLPMGNYWLKVKSNNTTVVFPVNKQ
jgi:hypothetical protein